MLLLSVLNRNEILFGCFLNLICYRINKTMHQKLNLPLSILILVLLIMCGTLIYIVMSRLRLY